MKVFFIKPVTEKEVEQEMHKLNSRKNVGFDYLSPKVIRQIAPFIRQPLTSIFNKSFSTGIIPDKLKISVIIHQYTKMKMSHCFPIIDL